MKFIDVARFKVKAGKGGDGAVSFLHELYVANGGPNGGDGGDGGSVIFVGDAGKHSLLDLKLQKIYAAHDGEKGGIKNMHGANGANKVIKVPLGTVLIDEKTKKILADISHDKQEVILAKGGKGGKGNARFANSRNKAPTIFEAGEPGQNYEVKAELKVLADVGFIGLPNAGKSTLLRAISNSKPEVADYAFTTLNPQLGTAKAQNGETFVVADLPGLIEGASLGKGLGHQFLKHIERCRIICHVIDWSGNYGQEDIIKNYKMIRKELHDYNLNLDNRLEIIIANKMDLDEAQINDLDEVIKKYFGDKKVIYVSGLKKENTQNLLNTIAKELKTVPKVLPIWELEQQNSNDFKLYQYHNIEEDIEVINLGNGRWQVTGETVFRIYQKNPITTHDNLLLFNEKLKKIGVYDQLRKRGAQKGDLVKVFEYELEWMG